MPSQDVPEPLVGKLNLASAIIAEAPQLASIHYYTGYHTDSE